MLCITGMSGSAIFIHLGIMPENSADYSQNVYKQRYFERKFEHYSRLKELRNCNKVVLFLFG